MKRSANSPGIANQECMLTSSPGSPDSPATPYMKVDGIRSPRYLRRDTVCMYDAKLVLTLSPLMPEAPRSPLVP